MHIALWGKPDVPACVALAAVLILLPAQQPLSDGKAETIIVTGERVKRLLHDTASSVSVATKRDIEAASADRIDQILELVPNVQIGSGGEGPTIRGQDTTGPTRDLPAFLGGTRARTTLIVDGRAVSFNEFIFGISPLWDVDRVEIFRSPQTTTQGRNSIAGAIFVTTKDPGFEPEYRARAIIGDARTRQLSAVAGGPIVANQLAWRASGDFRYSRTSSEIADRVAGANPNHDAFGLARFKLLATPSAIPGLRIELGFTHSQSQMPQVEGVRAPFRERRDPQDGYGTFRTNVDALTARLAFEPGSRLALSAAVTGGDSRIRRFAPPGLGETQIHNRDWSGEILANWAHADSLKLVAGVSHYHSTLGQFIDLSQLAGKGHFRDRQGSTGVFGEASWVLAPKATLTVGLRYQRDYQRRAGGLANGGSAIDLDFNGSFHAWLPKLSLAYDFAPSVRAGLLVERAYNPGGTTLRFDTGAADNFGAERLWDYELFARAGLFADALQLSANLFYYDQRNAQRAQPIAIIAPTGSVVTFADLFNVPKARSYGAELSADWSASRRFSTRVGIGLLSTRIVTAGDAGAAFQNKQFQRAPHLSASALVEWRPIDPLQLIAQLSHNSGYFSDDLNTESVRIGGWTRLDVRAQWETGRFRLFGYARNVFDKFYLTYLFAPNFGTAGNPRELGGGIEVRF